ncbi:MAG TPA: LytTR family DNA-binding domain-containing protein [Blastocatellia bacterium]|jgi:two-component system LytT family response regulator
MKIRALIADDEPHARRFVRQLLAADAEMEICGECADGVAVVEAAQKQKPDLLLLDVQMPEMDGFAALAALGDDAPPFVVFITAYDQYALKAFEAFALDYLLKPFDEERFARSLARVKAQWRGRIYSADAERALALARQVEARRPESRRLLVKTGGRVLFLRFADIEWIAAEDNYARIHTSDGEYLTRETLSRLETKLPPDTFVRIHRSTIVNRERVRELQPLPHGEQRLILHNGVELTVSRRYCKRASRILSATA